MPVQRKVLGVRAMPREHEARGFDTTRLRLAAEIGDGRIIVAFRQQPEHRGRHLAQDRHPRVEDLRVDLVGIG